MSSPPFDSNLKLQTQVDTVPSALPAPLVADLVPVLRPKLPELDRLSPYIRQIDESRSYSNIGLLCSRFIRELSRHLNCPEDSLVMAASATAGITAALLSLELDEGAVCVMPSWTFAATPHAALAAGLTPYFMDVDRYTWALDPASVSRQILDQSKKVAAVLVVSPFGTPLDLAAWERFQEGTGIPVIVDAAAGFDTVRHSRLISVVSLHATKIFGVGEGGFILCRSAEMRNKIRSASNFGFNGTRIAQLRAVNSKMSEYHAAVGLANLEIWPATRLRHLQIAAWYKNALKSIPDLSLQPGYGNGWACSTTNVIIHSDSAESIGRFLLREGVETRMWWGAGCHRQPAFQKFARENLGITDFLGAHVLGLPHYVDMDEAQVKQVAGALLKALRSRAGGKRRAS